MNENSGIREIKNILRFTISCYDQTFKIFQIPTTQKYFWLTVDAWINIDSCSNIFASEEDCLLDLYHKIAIEL
jgi:hypothetical protein